RRRQASGGTIRSRTATSAVRVGASALPLNRGLGSVVRQARGASQGGRLSSVFQARLPYLSSPVTPPVPLVLGFSACGVALSPPPFGRSHHLLLVCARTFPVRFDYLVDAGDRPQ